MYAIKKRTKVRLFKGKKSKIVEARVNKFINQLSESGCMIKDIKTATNGAGESIMVIYEEKDKKYRLINDYAFASPRRKSSALSRRK